MPTFRRDEAEIYYEDGGSGTPVLLIAPGGMKSAIPFWEQAMPWPLVDDLRETHRVITMDQLGLMDHLGIERFHVAGMCIGGPYCLSLIERAPQRVVSAVLFQTIGLTDNREAFYAMFDAWAQEQRDAGNAAPDEVWADFREAMYGGDELLFCVDEAFVSRCETPLLVLMGDDEYHPQTASRRIAELAPNATFIERWKQEPHIPAARRAVTEFLARPG